MEQNTRHGGDLSDYRKSRCTTTHALTMQSPCVQGALDTAEHLVHSCVIASCARGAKKCYSTQPLLIKPRYVISIDTQPHSQMCYEQSGPFILTKIVICACHITRLQLTTNAGVASDPIHPSVIHQ